MVNGPQRMAPKPLTLMKDTSSSSGKVFAKPSKEWVVPERTKPGRKISAEEPDNKRQSQNRQSQRAHRARRTDYITTLEERLRQYEADEIHSNVRLQEVARALKADNERLKKENAEIKAESEGLKRENGGLRMQLEGKDSGRRLSAGSGSRRFSTPRSLTNRPSPARQTTSRPTIACPICPDPDPDCPCQKPSTDISSASLSSAPFATLSLAAKALEDHDHGPSHASSGIESKITLTDSSCGVCRSDDECLCRVLKEEEAKERVVEAQEVNTASEGCGLCTSAAFCACKVEVESPKQSTSTRQAVSLSLKRSRVTSGPKSKVWDFTPSLTIDTRRAPQSLPEAVACSGDPSNCQACKDDSFGQEFCTILYSNPAIAKPCDDCPGNCMSISSLLNDDALRPREGSAPTEREGTMTPDRAWKALKAHPNSKLASLSLLADVVARHTKCIGYDDPVSASASSTAHPSTSHTRPSQSQDATGGPPITPNISGRGFRRRLEVETSGLRDALKVLDGFSQGPSSAENSPKRRKVELANDW